jgi:hypothetical protein
MAHDVFSVNLEYQTSDLDVLEEKVFPVLEKMVSEGKINEIAEHNVSAFFGAYLGELILRGFAAEKGFAWLAEEDTVPIIVCGTNKFNPVAKVHKRLTQGRGDDVRTFYKVCQAVANGSQQ